MTSQTEPGLDAVGWLPPGPGQPPLMQALRLRNDFPCFSQSCRARYGRSWTLRLPGCEPAVVTTDREAIRRLLTGDPLRKQHGHEVLKPLLGVHSLFVLEPPEHLARRRMELPAFHGDRVRGYADRVREVVDREVSGWRAGSVVEVHPRARRLMGSLMIEIVLGVRDPGLTTKLAAIFDAGMRPRNDLGLVVPALMTRAWWNLLSRRFWSLREQLETLLSEQIAIARTETPADSRKDVLADLVRATDGQGRGLSDAELQDELLTLIAAGHDTTATAIAWGMDLLAHHPSVASRVRATLADGDRSYLRATAREVLRLRTVVPFSAVRRSLDEFPIAGGTIGPGVRVYVDADGLHRDPGLHPDPDAFLPERFLRAQPADYSYLPFGGGAHRCLGATLATLSLELVLEAAINHCRLEPVGPPARPVRRLFIAPDNGAPVRIVPRHRTGAMPALATVAAERS